jgi:hypothetical protein
MARAALVELAACLIRVSSKKIRRIRFAGVVVSGPNLGRNEARPNHDS